ncbi:FAD-dependent oxidoreductase [Taibaiella soli]|uniref:Flavin-dependent monooxygenase n=1 Tax=Taibaiella soli TaxID=1649169 RepID=A0A2W2AWZ6_9BACT|nr:NAD(P)/FAD-dependent oxidoreductase [Taibaiella soli]PZF72504.1 FAD-dependent monooxygenase [Taibaiella soli]
MNTIQNKTIAIVGGGPGGLTLARLLQMNGAIVKVYERDVNRSARVQGATLDLHEESGLAAIRAAGLMDAFVANYRPGADKMRVVDKGAAILHDDDAGKNYDEARPEIDRGPLREILLDSLKPDTVVWNSQFAALHKNGTGFDIEFKNGNKYYADIVIGADGANSKIRPYITPIKPVYSGVTALEGAVYDAAENVPEMHTLLNGGKIFALGDDKTIIVSSKGDGSLAFYCGFNAAESWTKDSEIDWSNNEHVLSWFEGAFPGWDPIWAHMISTANAVFIPRPLYYMPLDQQWETLPNLTMIGDAAHLMPPYAGEGVNMAMLDALELSQCLLNESFMNVHDAISAYEKQMLHRASETTAMTLEQTAWMHATGNLDKMMSMFGLQS